MFKEENIDFTVNTFQELENQLSKCLEYIPFIGENKNTISPKFVTLILESCSLIESIFKIRVEERGGLKKYAKIFEPVAHLEDKICLFLSAPLTFFTPYSNWTRKVPDWWIAYNKLKHDRINNYKCATYENSIHSIAALHLLITRHPDFTNQIIKKGWFCIEDELMFEFICARHEECIPMTSNSIVSETKLFVSPLSENFVKIVNGENYFETDIACSPKLLNAIAIHGL